MTGHAWPGCKAKGAGRVWLRAPVSIAGLAITTAYGHEEFRRPIHNLNIAVKHLPICNGTCRAKINVTSAEQRWLAQCSPRQANLKSIHVKSRGAGDGHVAIQIALKEEGGGLCIRYRWKEQASHVALFGMCLQLGSGNCRKSLHVHNRIDLPVPVEQIGQSMVVILWQQQPSHTWLI